MDQPRLIYQFGPFRFDVEESLLLRNGEAVPLPPKALETLRYLLEHRGRLVSKDDLIKAVWPDTFVEEGALVQNVFRLRRALEGVDEGTRYIETVPKRGYRFVGPVEVKVAGLDPEAAPAPVTNRSRSRSRSRRLWMVVGATAVLMGAGLLLVKRQTAKSVGLSDVRRLTWNGHAGLSAISKDGKRVAYLADDSQGSSLWVSEVDGGRRSRVLGPIGSKCTGLSFSPDAASIYLVLDNALHHVPLAGGPAVKLIDDVDEAPAFSPDGRQVAFVREDLGTGESAVVVSNPDGSAAERLAIRRLPSYYGALCWRPDGKSLVVAAGIVGGARELGLVEIARLGGVERPVTSHRWASINGLAWVPSGSGLITSASEERWMPLQLWHVSYPGGEATRLNQDVMQYRSVTITRDGLLATTGGAYTSRVSVVPIPGVDRCATELVRLRDSGESEQRPAWLAAGTIVFDLRRGERGEIWRMDEDGGNRRRLTRNGCDNSSPAATPGGLIVLAAECGSTSGLWEMDANGAKAKPFWFGRGVNSPSCSRDGRWVFFEFSERGKPIIWRVDRQNGKAEPVTNKLSRFPAVSPDGRTVALYYWNEQAEAPRQIVTVPAAGGAPSKVTDLHEAAQLRSLRWSPDGRELFYLLLENGRADVWRQAVGGGAPRKVTCLDDDRTTSFDLSPDGTRIVCSRVDGWSDVVLFRVGR